MASCLTILLLLFLGSCSPGSPREPGVLVLRLAANPTTLDPAYIVDVTGGTLGAKMFNGLVRFGDDLSIQPDIASRWEISPDRRTYTFHLRSDASFTTGQNVTASDFKYSFERVLSPETRSPVTWVLDRIDGAGDFLAGKTPEVRGIIVESPSTLKIRLTAPFAPFLGLLAMPPAYVVPKGMVDRWKTDFASHPTGTGPYILTEWKHGQSVRFTANPGYFGEKPKIRGLLYRVIPEELTAGAEFETGRLDVLSIPAAEYRRYVRDPQWRPFILSRTGLNTYYLGLNCSRPPLSDFRVRQAIALAIDREKILKTVYENRGELARGPVPPILWPDRNSAVRPEPGSARSPQASTPPFVLSLSKDERSAQDRPVEGRSYDPDQARKLLQAAGYPDGFAMTLTMTPDPEGVDIAEVIQHYLKAVGIRVSIRQLEWSAFKEATAKGETDAFYLSWWADYPDPENFLFPLFHSSNRGAGGNRSRFADPVTDRLLEEAQGTADPGERATLYHQAEARIIDQAPWVFLWHKKEFVVHQPWVRGIRLYPIYSMDKGLGINVIPRTQAVIPAEAGIRKNQRHWIPASAGMTTLDRQDTIL